MLNTDRLLLRPERMDDAAVLYHELGCNPAITEYTGWNPYPTFEAAQKKIADDIEEYEKGRGYSWVIELDGNPVGTIGAFGYQPDVSAIEIGYSIFEQAWGQGIASAAVSEAVRFLIKDAGINRVHAWCHIDNKGSQIVLEAAGLKKEGRLKQAMLSADGKPADQLLYGIVSSEYEG